MVPGPAPASVGPYPPSSLTPQHVELLSLVVLRLHWRHVVMPEHLRVSSASYCMHDSSSAPP